MAQFPSYAATPRASSIIAPATADTSLTLPTNYGLLFTPGSNGSKVEEIDILGLGTTVAGRANLFLFDGTTNNLIDQYMIGAVTPAASQQVLRYQIGYSNLFVPTGSVLRVTVMETSNQSLLKFTAFGGDF